MCFVICMKMYPQMFACVEQMCQRRTDIKSSKQIPAQVFIWQHYAQITEEYFWRMYLCTWSECCGDTCCIHFAELLQSMDEFL